jgi:hypothetical protein
MVREFSTYGGGERLIQGLDEKTSGIETTWET